MVSRGDLLNGSAYGALFWRIVRLRSVCNSVIVGVCELLCYQSQVYRLDVAYRSKHTADRAEQK